VEGRFANRHPGRRNRDAQSQRKPVSNAIEGLEHINDCGIYHWASSIEAKLCAGTEVTIVGSGNSAGQAIVFLSSSAHRVHVLIRGDDLHKSMSSYLVERVTSLPNAVLHTMTTAASVEGSEVGLAKVVCQTAAGQKILELRHLFLFTGANPKTGWLGTCRVEVDEKGLVKTAVDGRIRAAPTFCSTVRFSSAKRVAAPVGDGAAAVGEIHSFLTARGVAPKH
jgi:thioredoxin reductase (NADPH)